jgi:hypothetical protein
VRMGYLAGVALAFASVRAGAAEEASGTAAANLDTATASLDVVSDERATLLAANIPRHLQVENPVAPRIGGAVTGLLGAGVVVYALATETSFDTATTLMVAGSSVWAVGGVTTFLVSDGLARDVGISGASLGLGTFTLGLDMAGDEELSVAAIALASGLYLSSALAITGMLIRPRTPYAQLARDYQRVRTPAARAKLSPADVRAIERDFELATRPIPGAVIHLPTVLGASVSLVAAALEEESDVPPLAGLALMTGLFGMFTGEAFHTYEEDLEESGLSLSIGPAPTAGPGLALYGTF